MSEHDPNRPERRCKPEVLSYLTPATLREANRAAGRLIRAAVLALFCLLGALLLIAILLQSYGVSRERANRVKCASNLMQIAQAMSLYTCCNKSYPRTRYDPTMPLGTGFTGVGIADPFVGSTPSVPGVAVNDPTAALFLLVKVADLNPEAFICPSSSQEKDTFTANGVTYSVKTTSNFTSAQNLSYSFANMYPGTAAVKVGYRWSQNVSASLVIAADRNDADPSVFVGIKSDPPQARQKLMNSRNHGQDGQNVLYNDWHVEWVSDPWVGAYQDNIYSSAKVAKFGSLQMPVNPAESSGQWPEPQFDLDTVLVPRKGNGF